ncbi:MAG: hypothetical protein KDD22_01630 [Bdellovibrionales bacterium]|nr:hypothetical protein [Bdellovibrionales bacterium]
MRIKNSKLSIARVNLPLAFFLMSFFLIAGCSTFSRNADQIRSQLRSGNVSEAAKIVEEKANKDSDDQIVFLFEYGTIEQIARDFDKSTKAFLKAEDLTEIKDYHSLSRITGSLLLNEGMVQYKGEDYEKVFINAMLAINYLMIGQPEEAMVETRRMNEKLYRYRFEAKRPYEQNPFAFYLAALIREENKDWDGAYIDFKRVHELNPGLEMLHEDLVRAGLRAQRMDDVQKWRKEFKVKDRKEWKDPNYGELVLIYQQGWAPQKRPHPNWPKIPKLYPTPTQTQFAKIIVEGQGEVISERVSSVQDVAIKALDDLYAGLIAKRMAGIAAKAVVADQIRQKNPLLGDLAFIGMSLADQADLRQWSTLPESFQIAKIYLKAGKYKVKVQGLGHNRSPTSEYREGLDVEIKPRKKTFLNWRSVQ